VNGAFGVLLEYDLHDYSYRVLTQIPSIGGNPHRGIRAIGLIKVEDSIFITLMCSWNIWEYDIGEDRLAMYGDDIGYKASDVVIGASFLCGNEIWAIPYSLSDPLIIFNIKTKTFSRHTFLADYLRSQPTSAGRQLLIHYKSETNILAETNSQAWITLDNSPYIVSVDFTKKEAKAYIVDKNETVHNVTTQGDSVWAALNNSKSFVRWLPDTGIAEKYTIDDLTLTNKQGLNFVVAYKDKIYAVPLRDNNIYVVDINAKRSYPLEYSDGFSRIFNHKRTYFFGYLAYGDKLLLFPNSVNKLIEIDMANSRIREIECRFRKEDVFRHYIEPCLSFGAVWEKSYFDVADFAETIKGHTAEKATSMISENIGKRIWEAVKGQ
jgi:hypothetical protein